MNPLLQATPRRYRFGAFEADTHSAELRLNGEIVPIQDVPFRFLVALLERPGEVVAREQLRERIWAPDLHLDFEKSLDTAAFKLRQAIGDSARNPHYVETLPGKGFRFLGKFLRKQSPRPSRLSGNRPCFRPSAPLPGTGAFPFQPRP